MNENFMTKNSPTIKKKSTHRNIGQCGQLGTMAKISKFGVKIHRIVLSSPDRVLSENQFEFFVNEIRKITHFASCPQI